MIIILIIRFGLRIMGFYYGMILLIMLIGRQIEKIQYKKKCKKEEKQRELARQNRIREELIAKENEITKTEEAKTIDKMIDLAIKGKRQQAQELYDQYKSEEEEEEEIEYCPHCENEVVVYDNECTECGNNIYDEVEEILSPATKKKIEEVQEVKKDSEEFIRFQMNML